MIIALIIRTVLTLLLFGLIMFVPYGSLFWLEAWIFFGIIVVYIILATPWFMKNNPQLVQNRLTYTPSRGLDRLVVLLMAIIFIVYFVIISYDAGQSKIALVPDNLKIAGFGGIILSFVFLFLTLRENTYASRIIDIKEDHEVISTGPYAFVRHPLYLGVSLFLGFLPLALGSFLGLIPWIIFILLLAYRIRIEEQALVEELPGYSDYTKKVRKRLIPFIW